MTPPPGAAHRVYLDPAALPGPFAEGTEARLEGAAARRLRGVLRLAPGARLAAFDGRGAEREAIVEAADREGVTLRLGAAREPAPEPPSPVTLACGFPRGRRGDWLVEKATEIGAAAFAPLAAERAVLRPGGGRVERWRRIAAEAARQSGRAVVPAFLAAPPDGALRLLADPAAATAIAVALAAAPPPGAAGVALFVGPEGGWGDAEREALLASGARAVALGPRPLRAETAAIVALAETLRALEDRSL